MTNPHNDSSQLNNEQVKIAKKFNSIFKERY